MNNPDTPPPPEPAPNPGSNEAIAAGCICAVLDNCHGRFPPIPAGTWPECPEGGWYITVGCPVHDAPVVVPAARGAADDPAKEHLND